MLWLKISGELPMGDFQIVGLPEKDYKAFLAAEDRFFSQYQKVFAMIITSCLIIFNVQLFFMKVNTIR